MNIEIKDEATGVPFLKTWSSVYTLVVCVLIIWILLLTLIAYTFA